MLGESSRSIPAWDPAVRLFHWTLALAFLAADVLEGVHEAGANTTLFLVLLHLSGVLFSSLEQGENLVTAMISGRKKEIQA